MKHYLFLQGPHGPFFSHLARVLSESNVETSRIAFNAADEHFWYSKDNLIRFDAPVDGLPDFLSAYFDDNKVTDIILYGDARPVHQIAIKAAKSKGITLHFFEEGYLRPYWVSYERNGVNGDSALRQMSMTDIKAKRELRHVDLRDAPSHWGQTLQHNWYGFYYHFMLWLGRRRYPNYEPHRGTTILKELRLNATRLVLQPWRIAKRDIDTRRFLLSGYPFFVGLLQLEHDASLQKHSDYSSQKAFVEEIVSAFAKGSAAPTRLVFKLHPFDDSRVPIKKWVEDAARKNEVEDRVMLLSGGALSRLISRANGGVTVNSTSVQQLLWRGIPIRLMGRSIFGKDEFASQQDLVDFFRAPQQPSRDDFLEFRSFLLETSQLVGGFYTSEGRSEIVRTAMTLLPNEHHPYEI